MVWWKCVQFLLDIYDTSRPSNDKDHGANQKPMKNVLSPFYCMIFIVFEIPIVKTR